MRVGEFAAMTGLPVHLLRHYHRRGWLVPAGATERGHRRYHPDQVATARLLLALHRTGLPPEQAAALAAERDRDALERHARELETWAAVVREAAGQPSPAREVLTRELPATTALAVLATAPVRAVAATVRERRTALLADAPATRRGTLPTWPDGPDGPRVRLLRPSYAAAEVDLRVLLPWPARRPLPPGASRARLPGLRVHVAEVEAWERATVAEVHAAHRAVELAWVDGEPCCRGGERWQLYDGAMQRMWVARECARLSPARPPATPPPAPAPARA